MSRLYSGLVHTGRFLGHFLLLIIRLYWGGLLIITGLGKWINIGGVADFFASLDIPFPLFNAYLVGGIEFIGGISLFLGLFSRIFTIPLIILFFVAYATAHADAFLAIFETPSLFISQEPFLFLYASLIVFCFGAGAISIDYWFEKKNPPPQEQESN